MRIAPTGFREYDARWRYPDDIDLEGVAALAAEAAGDVAQAIGLLDRSMVQHEQPAAKRSPGETARKKA